MIKKTGRYLGLEVTHTTLLLEVELGHFGANKVSGFQGLNLIHIVKVFLKS